VKNKPKGADGSTSTSPIASSEKKDAPSPLARAHAEEAARLAEQTDEGEPVLETLDDIEHYSMG
jgi:hypothetical protein